MRKPKVAIVHDILTQHGGAEKTVEILCEIYPDAPIFTSLYKKQVMGPIFSTKKIHTINGRLNKVANVIPILSKYATFLLPTYFEGIDLSEFDIVISSSSSYAKGVLTKPEQLHISYIHTPPRFLYGYSVESTKRDAWYYKPVVLLVDHMLRIWDFVAAQRPDFLVTNSKNVQKRISKFYRRDSTVIYPPVETNFDIDKTPKDSLEKPYYVALGRLSAYKNFDLVINAFNLLNLNLTVIGTGSQEDSLKKLGKENVRFAGRVDDEVKHKLIENSLGLIFPVVEEDFGITVVEALAHGKPVLAHNSGGPAEILVEGKNGMLFEKLDLESFVEKIKDFDSCIREKKFDTEFTINSAKKYSKNIFKEEFSKFVENKWKEHLESSL